MSEVMIAETVLLQLREFYVLRVLTTRLNMELILNDAEVSAKKASTAKQ
jgi:hypothetical protein